MHVYYCIPRRTDPMHFAIESEGSAATGCPPPHFFKHGAAAPTMFRKMPCRFFFVFLGKLQENQYFLPGLFGFHEFF